MTVAEVGDVYELKRDQWQGNTVKISKDPELLEEVKKYTWTYNKGKHPYIRNAKLGISLHEFVLGFVYGNENIARMQSEGNIIEHLDNNGLNCSYENLHILSEDLNKAKAFTIDKQTKEGDIFFSAFFMDVYYLHNIKQFQLQLFMNDNLYFNTKSNRPVEMFICRYNDFNDLFIDWIYLLNCRSKRQFDITKFHAKIIMAKEIPFIDITPEETNSPCIVRDGVLYLNLSAKSDGERITFLKHTALRRIDIDV